MKKSSSVVSLRRVPGKLVAAVQLLLFLVSAPVFASALIPQVGWTLKSADSEETIDVDGAATNAFDGDVSTFWHTQLQGSSPRPPHWIDIDLGAVHDVDGFRYLPRQDGGVDGRVEIFVFYVSMDGVNWGSAVAAGTLRNHAQEQEVSFALTQGRYIRFQALTEENGQPWTSVAELNVLGTAASGVNIEPNGVIDTPGDGATVEMGGTLNFSGSGNDPDSNALLSYRWTFGDPTVADQTGEAPRNVMFNTPGTHTVALTAVDHLGMADSTPATMQVTVNAPSATGVPPQTGGPSFPADLQGSAPEAATITVNISKPLGANSSVMTLTTYDADFPTEGTLVINGNAPITLFGTAGITGNDQNASVVTVNTPASYWNDGQNTLLFNYTSTLEFIIDDVVVSFYSDVMNNLGSTILLGVGLIPIASNANEFFKVDFDSRVANTEYTKAQIIEDFNANSRDGAIHGPDYGNTWVVKDPSGSERDNVLRVRHPAGKYGSGANFKARFAPDNENKKGSARFDDIYFAYDLYLPPDSKPMTMHKLPGLVTGTLLEASHATGESQVPEGIKSFSVRMQSYSSGAYTSRPYEGALSVYTYDAQRTHIPEFLDTVDPTRGDSAHSYTMPRGQWFTIEQRVKLNTADSNDAYDPSIDIKDGLVEVWINGVKMIEKTHLWRWTNTMKADGFWFTSYYNDTSTTRRLGQTPPQADQYEYFDNFRVSTTPITH